MLLVPLFAERACGLQIGFAGCHRLSSVPSDREKCVVACAIFLPASFGPCLTDCCLLHSTLQGEVAMKKVNFDAKLEHDFIKNYKILQALFDKRQITKVSPTIPC
jgi:hypothetical protein